MDIRPEPYAASPALTARLHLEDRGPAPVHAVALRAQVRLEPQRRAYSADEAAGLTDLFGSRERWASTLRLEPHLGPQRHGVDRVGAPVLEVQPGRQRR